MTKIIVKQGHGQPENPYSKQIYPRSPKTANSINPSWETFDKSNPPLPCYLPNGEVAPDGIYEGEIKWQHCTREIKDHTGFITHFSGDWRNGLPRGIHWNDDYDTRQVYICTPIKEDKKFIGIDEQTGGDRYLKEDKVETVEEDDKLKEAITIYLQDWPLTPFQTKRGAFYGGAEFGANWQSRQQNLIAKDKVIEIIENKINKLMPENEEECLDKNDVYSIKLLTDLIKEINQL